MKRLSLLFAAAIGFMACGDTGGSNNEAGGSIDSNTTSPSYNNDPSMQTDTATMDTTSSGINSGGTGGQGSAVDPSGSGAGSSDAQGAGSGAGSGATGSGVGSGSSGAGNTGTTDDAGSSGSSSSPSTDNNQSR